MVSMFGWLVRRGYMFSVDGWQEFQEWRAVVAEVGHIFGVVVGDAVFPATI